MLKVKDNFDLKELEKYGLYKTTGCGVNIVVNNQFQSEENLTNKEAMDLLDKLFNKEIRKIIMEEV